MLIILTYLSVEYVNVVDRLCMGACILPLILLCILPRILLPIILHGLFPIICHRLCHSVSLIVWVCHSMSHIALAYISQSNIAYHILFHTVCPVSLLSVSPGLSRITFEVLSHIISSLTVIHFDS